MPKFQVVHNSSLKPEAVFEKLDRFMSQQEEMSKFDSSAKWTGDAKSKSGQLKGTQFSAQVLVKPDPAGSQVVFEIEIGLLLTPLKNKITEVLQAKLKKYLV
jgi:hypothetical protein